MPLLLTKLQKDLKTKRGRGCQVDQIGGFPECLGIEDGETHGVYDGEFGVVGQRIAL